MTDPLNPITRPSGIRRAVWRWTLPLLAAGAIGPGAASAAAAEQPPPVRPVVVLLDAHTARVTARRGRPADRNRRLATAADQGADRPAGARHGSGRVLAAGPAPRPPQRPHRVDPGAHTRAGSTEWSIEVDLSARRVDVYQRGNVVRQFPAVVGKASTPTPRGRFFVEEAMSLSSAAAGGPYALATSARSNVLQEFDGGPGQIALHGRDHLAGALGTAASHGCVRLGTKAIVWLAQRIGAGTPLVIRR